jgi:hypothetical protein
MNVVGIVQCSVTSYAAFCRHSDALAIRIEMAAPRIFISSTFYDLRQIRSDIEIFIRSLGYDGVIHERGDVPYGSDTALEEYCYKEIGSCDILLSLIGGRFGSQSKNNDYSISQIELKTAIKLDRPVYIFIDKSVKFEYGTWQINKTNKDTKYKYVDNKRIFEFIAEIENLPRNNPMFDFETASDVTTTLRAQLAGLFQRMIKERSRAAEISAIEKISDTAKTLGQIVEYFREEKNRGDDAIKSIIMFNHPAFAAIKKEMGIPSRVAFLDRGELDSLAKQRNYYTVKEDHLDNPNYFEYLAQGDKLPKKLIRIFRDIFDAKQRLKPFAESDWDPKWINSRDWAEDADESEPTP